MLHLRIYTNIEEKVRNPETIIILKFTYFWAPAAPAAVNPFLHHSLQFCTSSPKSSTRALPVHLLVPTVERNEKKSRFLVPLLQQMLDQYHYCCHTCAVGHPPNPPYDNRKKFFKVLLLDHQKIFSLMAAINCRISSATIFVQNPKTQLLDLPRL